MNYFLKSAVAIFSLFVLLGSSSCKKEYTDVYETVYTDTVQVLAYNHISAFVINDAVNKDTIFASINGDDIIVYWPIWKTRPQKIAAEISIPAKASILPAKGDSVLFKTGTTYTVTAESGLKKTYALKVIEQQQPFYFKNNSTSYTTGARIVINGDYFMRGMSIRMFMEELGGNRSFELLNASFTTTGGNAYRQASATIPANADVAFYRLRVEHGTRSAYTVDTYDTIQVGYPVPAVTNFTSAITVQKGQTFTLNGTDLRFLRSLVAVDTYTTPSRVQSLVIESYTTTSATIRVPANAVAGTYDYYELRTPAAPFGLMNQEWGSGNYLTITN